MTEYKLTLQVSRPLPGMDTLLQIVEEGLCREGFSQSEYYAEVSGPPELQIRVIRR